MFQGASIGTGLRFLFVVPEWFVQKLFETPVFVFDFFNLQKSKFLLILSNGRAASSVFQYFRYIYIYIYIWKIRTGLRGLCGSPYRFSPKTAPSDRVDLRLAHHSRAKTAENEFKSVPRRSKTPPRRPKTPQDAIWVVFWNQNGTKMTPT